MILTIATNGYRSLDRFVLPLTRLNVITGPNGSGKSNVYKSLRLLSALAEGRLGKSLAAEGGFQSTLWAGPEGISREMKSGEVPIQGTSKRSKPIQMTMGFCADDFSYAIDLGRQAGSRFPDAVVKGEWIWQGSNRAKRNLCVERIKSSLRYRGSHGKWCNAGVPIGEHVSLLSELLDPANVPEVVFLREGLRNWRFYDHFDTSPHSPLRHQQPLCFTPALDSSGQDVAAALETIREIGEYSVLEELFNRAFPECKIHLSGNSIEVLQRGMLRSLHATELSDGTLRFICLLAALLTPRPPQLMILNEPETSLHPDMIPALADLIQHYSIDNQIIVVSHSQTLVNLLTDFPETTLAQLVKETGQTRIANIPEFEIPHWEWPKR